eukprot:TRINITY_DN3785_c0_g2_i2.p1 TRINITY_DN3785_c0_g2~~TRINITY_DN3785_c0_g2_i2.p1  ORF type:complete len:426 (+),score=26.76 TRINITY_DN3785_c0_g2_i2:175-1452(+)
MKLPSHKKQRLSSTSSSTAVGLRLDELFDELLLMVLGHVRAPDIGRFARVCRRFAALAREDSIWRPQVALLTCRSVDELSKPAGYSWRLYFERLACPVGVRTALREPRILWSCALFNSGGFLFVILPGQDILQIVVAEPAAEEQPWILVRRVREFDFPLLRPFGNRLIAATNSWATATVFDTELNALQSFPGPPYAGMFPLGSGRVMYVKKLNPPVVFLLDAETGDWRDSPFRLPQPHLEGYACVTRRGIALLVGDVARSCGGTLRTVADRDQRATTRQLRVVELDERFSIIKTSWVDVALHSKVNVESTLVDLGGHLLVFSAVSEPDQKTSEVHVHFTSFSSRRPSSWKLPTGDRLGHTVSHDGILYLYSRPTLEMQFCAVNRNAELLWATEFALPGIYHIRPFAVGYGRLCMIHDGKVVFLAS